jgi:hypothetical protein
MQHRNDSHLKAMKYVLVIALFVPSVLSVVAPDPMLYLKAKSFIGTFGFPASGNIWMHEMLRFTPGVSTIHEACTEKNGANTIKVCTNSQFSVRPLADLILLA